MSYVSSNGWNCPGCGMWIGPGQYHTCPNYPNQPTYYQPGYYPAPVVSGTTMNWYQSSPPVDPYLEKKMTKNKKYGKRYIEDPIPPPKPSNVAELRREVEEMCRYGREL